MTAGAKTLLENFLSENGAEGIRLSSIAGCCGPQYHLSVDAPNQTDRVEIISGIKVAIDAQTSGTDDLTLDVEETPNGSSLVLLGGSSCC